MAIFWKVFAVIAVIIVLRLCGVPWFWAMASVVGVVWAWSHLHAKFPAHKKKISLAITILLLAAIFPFVYGYANPYTWRSEEAGLRRFLFWDMWRAEKMDPTMLKSRLNLSNQRHWLEDQVGARHERALAQIRQDLASGRITSAEAWDQTQKVQNETAAYQQKATVASSRLTSSNPTPHYPVCPNASTYTFRANQDSIQVPIQPDCWSGWVIFPDQYKWWGAHSSGDLEFLLDNGQRVFFRGNEATYGWRPSGKFRLRGPGPYAKVSIEK